MISEVEKLVREKLVGDKSGHGFDHIERVYHLAMRFAADEKADKDIVALAALLHDVDDYKIVGKENAEKFVNAKEIMEKAGVDAKIQTRVIEIIKNMGYKNSLRGIRPNCLEGKILSDADMCDAIGAWGIIRSVVYSVSEKGSGTIFDKNIWPLIDGTTHGTDNAINHFFEKLLKIKNMMMTKSGKREATKRHKIMVDFLRHFFQEENLPDWIALLEQSFCYLM